MTDIKISKPRLHVILEHPDGAPDGQLYELDVQTDNRDAVRFDIMRTRKGWPGGDDAPMLWMTVMAWSAIKRSKQDPWAGLDFDKFSEYCVDLVAIDKDGKALTVDDVDKTLADPTQPVADSG